MKTLKVFNIGIAVSVISIFCIAPASSYIEQPITAVHDNLSDSRYAQATREVQYSTCNLNSSWVRPSEVDQAAKLNSLSSFRGIDFTSSEYWENDIFLLRLYGASALNSVVHLSGLWTIQDGIFECYSFSFDLEGASLGEAPVVWLLGYQIVGLSWQENTYVMQVEPVQSGAQLVQFSRIGNLSQFPLRIENQESRESASLDAENYGIVTAQLSLDLLNSLYFCHAPTYEIRDVLANMEADYFQHNGRLSTDGIATFQRQIDAYNANPQRPFTFPSWIMRLLNGEQVLRSDVTTAVGTSGCYYENVAADSLDSDSIPEEVTCENGLNYVLDRPRIVQVNPNFESRSTIRTFNLRFCPERTQIDQSSLTTGKIQQLQFEMSFEIAYEVQTSEAARMLNSRSSEVNSLVTSSLGLLIPSSFLVRIVGGYFFESLLENTTHYWEAGDTLTITYNAIYDPDSRTTTVTETANLQGNRVVTQLDEQVNILQVFINERRTNTENGLPLNSLGD